MTPDVLRKLEDAFAYCYTDEEACLYAGISTTAFYEYQEKHPEFAERKQLLRKTPNLKAKKTLVEHVGTESGARFWATTKMSDEFSQKQRLEISDSLDDVEIDPEDLEAAKEFNERLKNNVIKRRLAKKQP